MKISEIGAVNVGLKFTPTSKVISSCRIKEIEGKRKLQDLQHVSFKSRTIYSKFQNSLKKVEPSTIELILNRFKDYPRDEVLTVMNRLSTFSNMDSVVELKKIFSEQRVIGFSSFSSEYGKQPKYKKVNKASGKSQFFIENAYARNKGVTINHVFNYLFSNQTAKSPLSRGYNTAIVLDNKTLEYLEKLKRENPKTFEKYAGKKMFFIKDLENTYSVFNQHDDFEAVVSSALQHLKVLKKYLPNRSTSNLVDMLFNGRMMRRVFQLGLKPTIIDLAAEREHTPETISNNLSPKLPSFEDFENAYNSCVSAFASTNWQKKSVEKFFNERLYICTPKMLGQKLKTLRSLIEEDVKARGKDVSKIYYNVPMLTKSYSLINYMYQRINNIPDERYFYCDTSGVWCYKDLYRELAKKLPSGSTLVTLDDVMISGESMFGYPLKYFPERDNTSFDMVFASIYSTDLAEQKLRNVKGSVKNDDRIVFVDYKEIDSSIFSSHFFSKLYERTLVMLPHMTPDNNAKQFRQLFFLFYPDKGFVSESWDCG